MQGLTCDRCGETLLADSDVRYVVKIEVFAAYDPMEIAPSDLARDIEGEMRDLLSRMEEMEPQQLEDQVHKRFQFDLCPACQASYLKDPLGRGEVAGGEGSP